MGDHLRESNWIDCIREPAVYWLSMGSAFSRLSCRASRSLLRVSCRSCRERSRVFSYSGMSSSREATTSAQVTSLTNSL